MKRIVFTATLILVGIAQIFCTSHIEGSGRGLFSGILAEAATVESTEEVEVSTFAGIGLHGSEDGRNALFNLPQSIFGDGKSLIVLDTYNNLIRSIDNGKTRRIAGDIIGYDEFRFPQGYYRDGMIDNALFNRPMDGVVDSRGRIYILDSANHAIRRIDRDKVFTYIGGEPGYVDGRSTVALFNSPSAIAVDASNNLYIADTLNNCIRKIDMRGNVTTLAGSGLRGYTDGTARFARFNNPMGIAVSADGSVVYVADTGNHVIRMIRDGKVSTLAGVTTQEDQDGDPLGGFEDGANKKAMFNLPMGLALVDDVVIVADSANNRIRAITRLNGVFTLAGSGEPGSNNGPPETATFNLPKGVYVSGNILYIADTANNQIRRMPLNLD